MPESHAHLSPTSYRLPSTETSDRAIPIHESHHPSPRPYPSRTFIHILDDDSLLHIFHLCRPVILDEEEIRDTRILQDGGWARERWWYKLVKVCQRWRHLILASAHHLRLSLVCTRSTPVAEMLAHSPPLPLIIDDVDNNDFIAAEDEEGIMLALKHRDRVRRIRLDLPVPNLHKFIMALADEFPILEYLFIAPPIQQDTGLKLPKSLRAPQLRHLVLWNFAFPIGFPLLSTSIDLVTLSLDWISPSAYFHPNDLLQRLSQMPQIEILGITFHTPAPNRDVEWELWRRPRMTQVTLPNLSWFAFGGSSAYLEALLPCITAPRLGKLRVILFDQLTFRLPRLLEFLNTAENLRFSSATLRFEEDQVSVSVYPYTEARKYALYMEVGCRELDWQMESIAQILSVFRVAFSTVEDLALECWGYDGSSELRDVVGGTQWRDLLRSFTNVKTLRVGLGLVQQLARSLPLKNGESPMELLPELKLLLYPDLLDTSVFAEFVDAYRIAGRRVTLRPFA